MLVSQRLHKGAVIKIRKQPGTAAEDVVVLYSRVSGTPHLSPTQVLSARTLPRWWT